MENQDAGLRVWLNWKIHARIFPCISVQKLKLGKILILILTRQSGNLLTYEVWYGEHSIFNPFGRCSALALMPQVPRLGEIMNHILGFSRIMCTNVIMTTDMECRLLHQAAGFWGKVKKNRVIFILHIRRPVTHQGGKIYQLCRPRSTETAGGPSASHSSSKRQLWLRRSRSADTLVGDSGKAALLQTSHGFRDQGPSAAGLCSWVDCGRVVTSEKYTCIDAAALEFRMSLSITDCSGYTAVFVLWLEMRLSLSSWN